MLKNPLRGRAFRALRALLLCACLCVSAALPAAPAEAQSGEIWLRVGLYYGGSARSESNIYCADGFVYGIGGRSGWTERIDLSGHTSLTAVPKGNHVEIYSGDELVISSMDSSGVLMSAAGDGGVIRIDGDRYRDGVSYISNGSGKLTVVNYVELERYLWSVVGAEIGPTYPMEALKAQAVAARSFAIANEHRHSSQGFNLCDNTDCQAYKGLNREYSTTIEACRETEGEVITYGGRVVNAYYYASSSGETMNSEDVWVSSLGYARGVSDAFATGYEWESSISVSELYSRMKSRYPGYGEIISVEVTDTADNGAVRQIMIDTTTGPLYVSKGSITSLFGASTLKSLFFSMGPGGYPGFSADESEYSGEGPALLSSDGLSPVPETIYVLGSGGEPEELYSEDASVLSQDGTTAGLPAGAASSGGYVYETVYDDDDVIYFSGRGSGHGVGMPQTSMRAMAQQGYSYEDILNYYYTDIDIDTL
ncbi:MAG: SpoIID/LytB domain-containing protein [Firmicutes bacterium]|nr:SpoIID/LytB domain-containing protein [Bacillota bacterium]